MTCIQAVLASAIPSGVAPATTWNPADKNGTLTLSGGNLIVTNNGSNAYGAVRSTTGKSSGKWYWEVVINATGASNFIMLGIAQPAAPITGYPGDSATSRGYYQQTGEKYLSSASSTYGATYTDGDVIGFALDLSAGTITCYKNGVSQGTMFTGLTGTWFPAAACYNGGNIVAGRFKAADFTQTVPSGFTAIGV
jgi:hypothetical protein